VHLGRLVLQKESQLLVNGKRVDEVVIIEDEGEIFRNCSDLV
jgi:hypothetical protein